MIAWHGHCKVTQIATGAEEANLLISYLPPKTEPAHDVVMSLSTIGAEGEGAG